jgi:cytoskeletal protein CcmA (bactofilin family)
MWGNKKPETPQAAPGPQAAQPEQKISQSNQAPKPAPATWEGKTAMSTDALRPLGATADRATARLGASLHVKGEITGNEDLQIDGSVEGLIQLDERKLTVGATSKVTADVIAREVVVYGNVKGNLRAKDRIEIKKDGSVVGDLTTSRIMIEDGAYFQRLHRDRQERREGIQPEQCVCEARYRQCRSAGSKNHLTFLVRVPPKRRGLPACAVLFSTFLLLHFAGNAGILPARV